MDLSYRCRTRVTAIAAALFLLSAGAPAAVHRLSAGQAFSNVELGFSKPALKPDGKRVVYCQDAELDGGLSLWSVRVAGGAPVRLSPALPAGRLACWFRISPNGSRVVYVANQNSASTYELFSAPIDGSAAAIPLNPALTPNGNVSVDFQISPDSSTVVYRADQVIDDRIDLWSVPIGGGTALKVNVLGINSAPDVNSFSISPSGLHVAYLSDEYDDERFIVIGRPIGGGGVSFIAEVPLIDGDIFEFRFTPDGSRVIMRADLTLNDRTDLCRVTTDGSGVAATFSAGSGTNNDVQSFAITPDGLHVVFLGDLDVDNVVELYTISPFGTNRLPLNDDLVDGGDVDGGYALSGDSARVVYVADQELDGHYELFSVPSDTGGAVPLNPVLPAGSNVAFDPLITPDSARVVYRVIQGFGLGTTDLDSVPILGGTSELLSPVPATGFSTAQRQVLAAGGAHLFYELQSFPDSPGTNATTLYRAAVAGGELLPITPVLDLASGETFSWLGASADPRSALFVSNDQTGFQTELYVGDICLLCDGFESQGTTRWSSTAP